MTHSLHIDGLGTLPGDNELIDRFRLWHASGLLKTDMFDAVLRRLDAQESIISSLGNAYLEDNNCMERGEPK